jgi:hypothetical protein
MARRNGSIIGPANIPTGGIGGVASGVWRIQDAMNYQKAGLWPVVAANPTNSVRFNAGSSDYLSRTPSASNRKTWTYSAWVKRAPTGDAQMILDTYSASTDAGVFSVYFANSSDVLTITGWTSTWRTTTQVFRDFSAWYHIVISLDTTQATASNRLKLYVNGTEVTSFNNLTNPSLNQDLGINQNAIHTIGKYANASLYYYGGYMSDVYLIDGQALDASYFGEVNSATGIWTPVAYGGSFGTNGFNLKFENAADLGEDSSINGNDFTVNNLTSIDQTTDLATNNFATGNPLIPSTLTYTDGNCTIQRTTSDWESTGSTLAVTQGKWYAEFKWISGTFTIIGVEDMELVSIWDNEFIGKSINGRGYGWDGDARNNSSTSAFGNSFTTGDIIGVALDMDNKFVYMSKNGVFQNSGVPTSGATGTGGLSLAGTEYVIGWSGYSSVISANFGNPPYTISSGNADTNGFGNFEYAVPSGYYALNTYNLNQLG